MKREEHYCDRCGIQMTSQDCDGDTLKVGITIGGYRADVGCTSSIKLVADSRYATNCGSASARHQLYGAEFCGIKCFTEAMDDFVKDVQEYAAMKGDTK